MTRKTLKLMLLGIALSLLAGWAHPLAAAPQQGKAKPQVIDVVVWTATWCKYCQRDKPELERLTKTGRYYIIYLDYDKNRELAKENGIKALPTYWVVKNGKILFETHSLRELKEYEPPTPRDKT